MRDLSSRGLSRLPPGEVDNETRELNLSFNELTSLAGLGECPQRECQRRA